MTGLLNTRPASPEFLRSGSRLEFNAPAQAAAHQHTAMGDKVKLVTGTRDDMRGTT